MTLSIGANERALLHLVKTRRVRTDWHEPDEQGLTAMVGGKGFDNALEPNPNRPAEDNLSIYIKDLDTGQTLCAMSLATLCAWATVGIKAAAVTLPEYQQMGLASYTNKAGR